MRTREILRLVSSCFVAERNERFAALRPGRGSCTNPYDEIQCLLMHVTIERCTIFVRVRGGGERSGRRAAENCQARLQSLQFV